RAGHRLALLQRAEARAEELSRLLLLRRTWSAFGTFETSGDVRFSNRPFGVKALSDYPPVRCRCRSRARASLRNRHQAAVVECPPYSALGVKQTRYAQIEVFRV